MRIGEFLIAGRPGKYGDRGHKKKSGSKKNRYQKHFFRDPKKKNGLDRNEGRKEGGKGREGKGREEPSIIVILLWGGGAAP